MLKICAKLSLNRCKTHIRQSKSGRPVLFKWVLSGKKTLTLLLNKILLLLFTFHSIQLHDTNLQQWQVNSLFLSLKNGPYILLISLYMWRFWLHEQHCDLLRGLVIMSPPLRDNGFSLVGVWLMWVEYWYL